MEKQGKPTIPKNTAGKIGNYLKRPENTGDFRKIKEITEKHLKNRKQVFYASRPCN